VKRFVKMEMRILIRLRTQVLGEEVREVAEIVVDVHGPPHAQGQLVVETGEEE
jgi:hypothetical protein